LGFYEALYLLEAPGIYIMGGFLSILVYDYDIGLG
jgi:hypothetical protein